MTQSGPECQICAPRPCHCREVIEARLDQWLVREMRSTIREILRHIHNDEVDEEYMCRLLSQWLEENDNHCPIEDQGW